MYLFRLVPALAALLAAGHAHAAILEVTIANLKSADGTVRVSLCDRNTFLKNCEPRQEQPARSGLVFRFEGVAPGRYAVAVHHDANGNGRLDRNLFGIPTEGTGFSRNPQTTMGPPAFDDAAVEIVEQRQGLEISLSY